MRTVGLGIQDFEKIRSNNQFYVDKTGFIGEWYRKNDDITLITRPRRFGKTLTMDMLHCFFSTTHADRGGLFEGLEISRDVEMMGLQGTRPVIMISFAGVKGDTFREFLLSLSGRLGEVLREHSFLVRIGSPGNEGGSAEAGHKQPLLLLSEVLTEEEKELFREMSSVTPAVPDPEKDQDAYIRFLYKLTHILKNLSAWLFRYYGKKVLILLDEYDTPLQTAFLHHYYEDAMGIMRTLFSETFKENNRMWRAVITGITRIAKESLFSEMNNLAVCSVVTGGYDRAFGFTQDEMDRILEEYDLTDRKDLLRFWYDGFTIGQMTDLYNPWSVLSYLSRRDSPPEDYWAQSGGLGLVDHLLKHSGIAVKEGFEVLLSGGVLEKVIREDLVFPRLLRDENAVWSLLIAAGYLKPLPKSPGPYDGFSVSGRDGFVNETAVLRPRTRLTLTNHEARVCLYDLVNGWFETPSGNYMEKFAEALMRGDLWEMNAQMQDVVSSTISFFDSGQGTGRFNAMPENFFHGLALGMLTCLAPEYRLTSNRESGRGRYDLSLIPSVQKPGRNAYILEFKVFSEKEGDRSLEDTAARARRQIDERDYGAELRRQGFPEEGILKYGLGFRGKDVVIVS